jgi:small-conductance mechanosensitive channel
MIAAASPRRSAARIGCAAVVAVALVLVIIARVPAAARAQQAAPVAGWAEAVLQAFPRGMTPEQLDAVLAVMDQGEIRAALRERWLADFEARTAITVPVEGPLELYMQRLASVGAAYPSLPAGLANAFARPRGGLDPPIDPLGFMASILAIAVAATAAMLLVRRALVRARRQTAAASPVRRVITGILLDAAEVTAFIAGLLIAYAALRLGHPLAPSVLLVVLHGALAALMAGKAAGLLLAPEVPASRLVPIGDRPARVLYRTVVTVVLLAVIVAAAARILAVLGLPPDPLAAAALPLSLLPFVYLIVLTWQHRDDVITAVTTRLHISAREAPLLAAWPVLATAYLLGLWIVVTWGVVTSQPGVAPKALASLFLFLALPLVAWLVQRPLARFYDIEEAAFATSDPDAGLAITDEYGDALPVTAPVPATAGPEDGRHHVQRLMRAVWAVLIALAVVLTAWIWGFDPERHAGVGGFVLRLLFNVGVVLLLGYVAWALIVRSINERLEAARLEQGSARAQRMATLLPLLRRFLQVVLATVTVMIVLSSLGVDIGPLIAGAGVVGLAIGLGAQQTIADILAGVFFLIEDAFRIGDYVEVGTLRGTVEGISLRSLKLRHHRGAVHTLPFGQMKSLTNYTRDWALMRLEFRVDPETDVGLVKRLVKGIAKELLTDPEIGPSFIEPLKSQGIRNVEDGALVIGVKFIAKPGEQFVIRREAYQRILKAFHEHGIELVGRGVVVKVEGTAGLDGHAVGAAAAEAVRETALAAAS